MQLIDQMLNSNANAYPDNDALNVVMMSAFYLGNTLIVVDRFEAQKVLAHISRHKATYFAGTPTMYVYLLQAYDPVRHDVTSLRVVNCGGAHCPASLIENVEKTFKVFFLNGYGQTEGCGFTTLNPIVGVRKTESVGIPLANIWLKIVDDNFKELPVGQVGEIAEKGDVFSIHGYWKQPAINVAVAMTKGSSSVNITIVSIFIYNLDGLVKSPKRANFQISHLIISIGYEVEI